MVTRKLNLTRDQLATFLVNQEQIRQFEQLFQVVDTLEPIVLVDFEFAGDNAQATANNALTMIAMLAQDTAVSDAAFEAKLQQALDAIPRLAQTLELLAIAPVQNNEKKQNHYDCCNTLVGQLAELQKQVDGLQMAPRIAPVQNNEKNQNHYDCCNTLVGQLAELQKQVDGLHMAPRIEMDAETASTVTYFASPVTITATTTNPTKPTTGILVDEISVVDDGSGWCECVLTFKVDPATRAGAANGNGQYIFHLPAGVEFDSTLHAPFTNVTDTPGADDFRFSLPAVVSLAVSGFASVAGNVFPFSATSFRMTSQRGIGAATFCRSGSFEMGIIITYQTSFRFKKV